MRREIRLHDSGRDRIWAGMSNSRQTSKTRVVALRLPLDLVRYAESQGGNFTALVVHTLREAWKVPGPEVPPASYWAA